MTDHHQKDIEVFNTALEIESAEEREAFLDQACSGVPARGARVRALLDAYRSADTLFDDDSTAGATGPASIETIEEGPGTFIGPFKLLQKIGEGGMGVVYMAEQEVPIRRRVAVKVIKVGMDTRQVVARFEAERQALATMDHSNIAKVFEGGSTASGRPYFAMELVKGIPITEFCEQQRFGPRRRLELFKDVCSALNHAHQKGIIHRDLKPSNVMVTLAADVPVVKIIDFGIAKAIHSRLTEKTLFTRFEQFLGTPVYMSPEQAAMSAIDVDTRSDIYSLGVLLYELLAGAPPFDQKSLLSAGYDEMRRIIAEDEPPKPSTKLTQTQAQSGNTVGGKPKFHLSPSALKGELDWIVMKAIEKDRTRRYETASAFAADIERYLADEPVQAAAPSAAYKFRKFARRHKGAFGVAAAMVVLLLAGIVATTWQAVRATAEANRAEAAEALATQRLEESEEAREDAEAISEFLTGMFASARPGEEKGGREVRVADVLDRAVEKLETELADQPERRAKLQATIGETYRELGLHPQAIELEMKVLDYCEETLGPEHLDTLEAMANLAHTYNDAGRLDEAVAMGEKVLALRRKVLGPEHDDTLTSMNNLAVSYSDAGRLDEALELQEEVLTGRHKLSGSEDPSTLSAINNLAVIYGNAGRWNEALELVEKVLPLRQKVSGPEHPATVTVMHNLAGFYDAAGRLENEALALLEEALRLRRNVLGPRHPLTLLSMGLLAGHYHDAGHRNKALEMREELLARSQEVLGSEHPATLRAMNDLAVSYRHVGRLDEALEMGEKVLALERKVSGSEHPATLRAMNDLAVSYRHVGRLDEALEMGEKVLALERKVSGSEHPTTLAAMNDLAVSYRDVGRLDEALEMGEKVLALRRKVSGPEHPTTLTALNNLASFYGAVGRLDEALEMREVVLALRRKVLGAERPKTLTTMNNLAGSYEVAGRPQEALDMREEVLALRSKVLGAEHPDTLRAMNNLASSYDALGRTDEAVEMQDEVLALSRKVLGSEHPQTLTAVNNLAFFYDAADRRDEALALWEEGLARRRKVLGEEHTDTLTTMHKLAHSLEAAGRLEEAIKLFEEDVALSLKVLGEEDSTTRKHLDCLAKALTSADRGAEATKLRERFDLPLPMGEEALRVAALLVAPDSEWKWLHPLDGVDPKENDPDFHRTLFTNDYDDSAWQTGKDSDAAGGGFGYGDDWFTGVNIRTPEGEPDEHEQWQGKTAYFRHRFTTKETHTNLELRCQRDDGIIIYLDDREVARDNMANGDEAYDLPALMTVGGERETATFRIPLKDVRLQPGEHVLAISLHNHANPSSDLRIGGISLVEVEAAQEK